MPWVTFGIPTTLPRATLNRTLVSLPQQTHSDAWNAIVGVDAPPAHVTSPVELAQQTRQFLADARIQYQLVKTETLDRGLLRNGAGPVRNPVMQHILATKSSSSANNHHPTHTHHWIAFVDNDDTIHPLEYWQQGMAAHPTVGIILFRMKIIAGRHGILPPMEHGFTARENHVGIRLAVRLDLWGMSTPSPDHDKHPYTDPSSYNTQGNYS